MLACYMNENYITIYNYIKLLKERLLGRINIIQYFNIL